MALVGTIETPAAAGWLLGAAVSAAGVAVAASTRVAASARGAALRGSNGRCMR